MYWYHASAKKQGINGMKALAIILNLGLVQHLGSSHFLGCKGNSGAGALYNPDFLVILYKKK